MPMTALPWWRRERVTEIARDYIDFDNVQWPWRIGTYLALDALESRRWWAKAKSNVHRRRINSTDGAALARRIYFGGA